MATHHRTCTLCEAMCGLRIEHEGDTITAIRGDEHDVLGRGHVCPKGVALIDLDADPDRLRTPLIRDGAGWRPASWDEAIAHAADGLARVRDAHGADALAIYNGNPTVHSLGAMLFVAPLVRALGTRNRYSATSVDQLPHHVAAMHLFGHGLLLPIPDLDRTGHLLVIGANPAASNGSLMSGGDTVGRIKAIRARGGRVVVVDPRRTETARLADAHHFIRPGSDALLLLAMLHVILSRNLERTSHLTPLLDGLEVIGTLAARFTPASVADATGLDAATIETLATEFAAAERAVCYGRVGTSMQPFGALCAWLVTVLNVVTGNLDREGGAMFTHPAIEVIRGERSRMGRWRSRVRGLPEFDGELPVAALAEEIDTPGAGQVRALVTQSGNPVLSTPNGARLDAALASLDFMVSIDFYLNETTRHAHVILPPTGPLERDHYDLVFATLATRNVAKWSPALRPRAADARHDWEIMALLAERLAPVRRARWSARAMRLAGPARLVDLALRTGPYGAGIAGARRGAQAGRTVGDVVVPPLTLDRLRASPHGVDLGPLRPALPERLRTKDGRIMLAPAPLVADVVRLERWIADDAAQRASGALSLIGRRGLRSNNSWMHNAERLVRGRDRCTLLVHPADAAARGIADGDVVRVTSRTGSVTVPAEVSDAVMPGVVSLPHGWGHTRPGTGQRIAAAHPGVSINDLTDDRRLDEASGNAAFSGTPVVVERLGSDGAESGSRNRNSED